MQRVQRVQRVQLGSSCEARSGSALWERTPPTRGVGVPERVSQLRGLLGQTHLVTAHASVGPGSGYLPMALLCFLTFCLDLNSGLENVVKVT